MKKTYYFITRLSAISLLLILLSCKNENHQGPVIDTNCGDTNNPIEVSIIENATEFFPYVKIFVENSGSMFGYVRDYSDFTDVVSKIIYDDDFIKEGVSRSFYFINGDGQKPNKTFSDGQVFLDSMNEKGMKSGNYLTSDLNGMLKSMLAGANGDTITILISDGIYDIGSDNLTKLKSKGEATKSTFMERLKKNKYNQTMVIKLVSPFNGNYCYATKKSSVNISNKSPTPPEP